MKKKIVTTLSLLFTATILLAQEPIRSVENVEIKNLNGATAKIPYWGEKNLLIFYVDPDRASMNQDFTDELERSNRAKGDNLVGMGVMNLKDAPFVPNALARKMAEKRTEKNNALVMSDEGRVLCEEWKLGDCNNNFVTILINRAGELLYVHKGEFDDAEAEKFYKLIDILK